MASACPLSLLFLLAAIVLIFTYLRRPSSKGQLPPGPLPWPVLGNLLHLGKKPHIQMTQLSQAYGPLISLKLGTQLFVVGSSPAVATEILKTQDRILSARHLPSIVSQKDTHLQQLSLAWASECSDHWRFLRALCKTELFSAKAIDTQSVAREKKVMEVIDYLREMEGQAVNLGRVVFVSFFNMMANIIFSKDFVKMEDQENGESMEQIVLKLVETGTATNLADFYPVLNRFDVQGLNKQSTECLRKFCAKWEDVVRERREGKAKNSSKQRDFLDAMLENGFSDDQVNILSVELFTGGSETSASVIEWAMAELVKSPAAMKKVVEEVDREIKGKLVKESDLPRLPYLQACVKESLRMHPPVPLLLPHRASASCTLTNYTIPKGAQVHVNVWAIGRDPETWEDPLVFRPERFIGSHMDFQGTHFEFIPFGAGRRICPGYSMAVRQIQLILASLIHCFDWSLPNDAEASQLDMNEKWGATLHMERPLLLIPKLKR